MHILRQCDQFKLLQIVQIEPEDSDKDSVKEEKENQDNKEDNFKAGGAGPFSLLQAKSDHSFGLVRPNLPHSQVQSVDISYIRQ